MVPALPTHMVSITDSGTVWTMYSSIRSVFPCCTAILCTGLSLDGGMPVTASGINKLSPLDGRSTLISPAMTWIRIVICGARAVAGKSVIVVSNSLEVVINADIADKSTIMTLVPVVVCGCTAAFLLPLPIPATSCHPQCELSLWSVCTFLHHCGVVASYLPTMCLSSFHSVVCILVVCFVIFCASCCARIAGLVSSMFRLFLLPVFLLYIQLLQWIFWIPCVTWYSNFICIVLNGTVHL